MPTTTEQTVIMVALWAHLTSGAVFLLAAVAKTWRRDDRRAFVDSLASVGVARRWRGPVQWAVILAEFTTAALVVIPSVATVGSLLAVALLVAFTGTTIYSVITGRPTRCACFGGAVETLGPI